MAIEPSEYTTLALAAVNFALAGGLLYLRFNSAANQAFALFLIARGGNWTAVVFGFTGEGVVEDFLWASVQPYFFLLLAFAMVWFGLVYPTRRRIITRFPAGPYLFWGMAIVVQLLYAMDHRLFQDLSAPALLTDPYSAYPLGPLAMIGDLFSVVGALLALVFLMDFARMPAGSARQSVVLVSLGFVLFLLFDFAASTFAGQLFPAPLRTLGYPPFYAALQQGAALLVLGVVVAKLFDLSRKPDKEIGGTARAYLLLAAAAVMSGVFVGVFLPADGRIFAESFLFWRVALPLFVVYGLLRYQLFDIDVKVKWGIKRGTIASVFLLTFLVVTQLAQQYFQTNYEWVFGGVAAGLLLFAIAPLQRAADRIANAAMPNVHEAQEFRAGDKTSQLKAYRAAVEMALADGVITRAEERSLATVAHELGLSPLETLTVREEVEKAMEITVTGVGA
ncbi:MAG: hypothetical protein HY556_01155 [Euryarchaeota archaeon]|nr:hypothetical protein [Euryarchaeota archaeon]